MRVRLTRIDTEDLSLFEFDYDLTMVIFFMDGQGRVYSRYGGRDATSADARQSLEGLRYTMLSVLAMHEREEKEFAEPAKDAPKSVRSKGGGCLHCHNVRERLNDGLKRDGKWTRDMFYRYPLPENLGFALEIHRGNTIKSVTEKSPAAQLGIKKGDFVKRLGGVPIHSFGDAQFALDRAPTSGQIEIAWLSGAEPKTGMLALNEGWRKTDLTWRASMRWYLPGVKLAGADLDAGERNALGLTGKQLAFRQREAVSLQARNAGIKPGDVILGVDGAQFSESQSEFQRYVERNYVVGDRVNVDFMRDGKRMSVAMTLIR